MVCFVLFCFFPKMHWWQMSVTSTRSTQCNSTDSATCHLLCLFVLCLLPTEQSFFTWPIFLSELPWFLEIQFTSACMLISKHLSGVWSIAAFKNGNKRKSKLYIFWHTTHFCKYPSHLVLPHQQGNTQILPNTRGTRGRGTQEVECRLEQSNALQFLILFADLRRMLSTNLYQTQWQLHKRQSRCSFSSS